MADFRISPHLGRERAELNIRVDGRWRRAQLDSWQRIGDQWWATVTFLTEDGTESRTSVPVSQIRPSDA